MNYYLYINSLLQLLYFIPCGRLCVASMSVTEAVNSAQAPSRRTEKSYLVLLCSQPDTVRRHLSRKTQTSTSLTKGSQTKTPLGPAITPAIADCRYRAPLTPRLRGFSSITKYEYHVKNFPALRSAKNCFIMPLHSSSRTPPTMVAFGCMACGA